MRTALKALLAAGACLVAVSFSAQAAQTIRLAHTAATSHAHHAAALQFAKNVGERTKGELKVEVYPSGELGDQPALAEQVTMSALDMAVVSLGNMAMYSKKLNAMTAPFLFESYDQAHKVIDSFVMPWMNEGLAQYDAVGLSMFDYGFRQTTTNNVVVKTADDLKGVKIRVPPATGLPKRAKILTRSAPTALPGKRTARRRVFSSVRSSSTVSVTGSESSKSLHNVTGVRILFAKKIISLSNFLVL